MPVNVLAIGFLVEQLNRGISLTHEYLMDTAEIMVFYLYNGKTIFVFVGTTNEVYIKINCCGGRPTDLFLAIKIDEVTILGKHICSPGAY